MTTHVIKYGIWPLNLASKKFGKICLILTRLNGILPDDELMNWRRLSGRNIHLAVVCVDDNSKISFIDEDKLYLVSSRSTKTLGLEDAWI